MPEFVKDIEAIRQRAIHKIDQGPVTQAYGLDPQKTIAILNEALATEIVCVLRYLHHYFMATGVHGRAVAEEFKEHADSEREHADRIAERIQQLGGKPDFNPGSLVGRSVSQYVEGETLAEMIREDLIAERVVIDVYTDMIRFFGDDDPTTRIMLEAILKDEEEHAADLSDLLYVVDPATGETQGQDPGTRPLSLESRRQPEEASRGARAAGRRSREAEQERPDRNRLAEMAGGRRQPVRPDTPTTERGEVSPSHQTQESFPGRGSTVPAPPEHEPGTVGHPTRPRPQQTEIADVDEDVDAGAHSGGTRAVRVTKPNRKKRVA